MAKNYCEINRCTNFIGNVKGSARRSCPPASHQKPAYLRTRVQHSDTRFRTNALRICRNLTAIMVADRSINVWPSAGGAKEILVFPDF